MTPTFKGLGASLAGLKHTLDALAAPMAADIEELAGTAPALLKQAATEIAATRQAVADIKDFVEGLKTNGAPPLEDSPDGSRLSPDGSPADGPGAASPSAGAASPDTGTPPETRLTVNGVQAG